MTTDANTHQQQPQRSHRDYYTALHQAAITFTSSLEPEQVLQSIVTSTSEAMQIDACTLRLLDRQSGQLSLSCVHGLSDNYLSKGPVNLTHSAIDNEAMCGTPVYVPDVRNDTRFQYQEAARQEGLVSVLCVPLEVRGEAIGVIRVYTKQPTTFAEDDIQFLTVLASLAALSIENSRLYESMRSSYNNVMGALWGTQSLVEPTETTTTFETVVRYHDYQV
ncbi:GAF domain-containing protein [Ktedonospora formicarum]|uniref:GAF domain-containing protein n=1 Tax=Ktedonospora formicarum TaxID=2778364 RepID=A0A8J3HYK4_9CHLR|nr:GAF domain-containing protein [Ktedonospora formicarum]GHO43388.1 hypothetical protein KSX_15510 [Ktedonospora formicarum]